MWTKINILSPKSMCSKQDKSNSLRIIDKHEEKNDGQDGPIICCLYGCIAADQSGCLAWNLDQEAMEKGLVAGSDQSNFLLHFLHHMDGPVFVLDVPWE